MSLKDLIPWHRRTRSGQPMEEMRSMVESIGRGFGAPRGGLELEVSEEPKKLTVTARLAGFDKKDIEIDLAGRFLTLRARKRSESGRRHGARSEFFQAVERTITLPAEIKGEEARAHFKAGELRVELPKLKESEVKKVEIQ